MPFLSAACTEPRHLRGGAGGVRPRRRMRRSEQTVDVPERVYRGPHYSDAFKKAWCKMAALDVDGNLEHCNASVANMAAFTGLSKSSFERALTQGRVPGPDGGQPEFTTRRMTRRGGRGRTAIRTVRAVAWGERCVTVPMWIADAAEPRELAAVLLIAHAEREGHPLTAEELAGELFHHQGKRKGETVSERTARRVIDRCEAKGFLDVDRRAGYQGRHVLTVREAPLEAVPDAPVPTPGADNHDGSGPDNHDGSLAYEEDQRVCTDGSTQERGSSAVGEVTVSVSQPVDTAGNTLVVPPALQGRTRPCAPPAYAGPQLTLSPRVWAALTPVRDLLPGISVFAVRRIAREVGRQLDDGIWPEEIRDQLARLRAWTPAEDIRDPGRWLLGAVLPVRSRCGRTGCHWGFLAHTGMPCKACAELASGDSDPPDTDGPPPRPYACTACSWTSPTPLPYDRCAACRPT